MPNPILNRRLSGNGPTVGSDWANQVVANGGAYPSQTTINAYNTLYSGIVSSGLRSKIYNLNGIPPDSIIASKTPFIHDFGAKLWVETTSGANVTDLTVNGIKAPSSTNVFWNTFFQPGATPMTANSGGITAYIFSVPGAADISLDIGYNNTALTNTYALTTGNAGFVIGDIYAQTAGATVVSGLPVAGWNGTGYLSDNRTGATTHNMFAANSGSAHQTIATNSGAGVGSPQNSDVYIFQSHVTDGANIAASTKRFSFFMFHEGFTSAESNTMFNLIQAFRTSLGGGFI
jgi:hypothetical protein